MSRARKQDHAHDYDGSWRCAVPGCGYELPPHLRGDRCLGQTEQLSPGRS
jgi:hypothetical protein